MKGLFKETYQQLSTLKDSQGNPRYIRMWNNQAQLLMEGRMELFQTPACFIEFVTAEVDTLLGGEGVQLYNPIYINLHILHWQLDAASNMPGGNGTFEQNLDVFDIKQEVFLLLQKFKPSKGSMFVRIAEQQDYEHAGVYHFIQRYRTTWVDDTRQEPYLGSTYGPVTALEIDLTKKDSEDNTAPHVYTFSGTPYLYKYDVLLDGTPAAGKLQFNTTVVKDAVSMYVNHTDRNTVVQTTGLNRVKVGDMARIAKDANNYWTFKITSVVDSGSTTDYGVEFQNEKGTIADTENITMSIY